MTKQLWLGFKRGCGVRAASGRGFCMMGPFLNFGPPSDSKCCPFAQVYFEPASKYYFAFGMFTLVLTVLSRGYFLGGTGIKDCSYKGEHPIFACNSSHLAGCRVRVYWVSVYEDWHPWGLGSRSFQWGFRRLGLVSLRFRVSAFGLKAQGLGFRV